MNIRKRLPTPQRAGNLAGAVLLAVGLGSIFLPMSVTVPAAGAASSLVVSGLLLVVGASLFFGLDGDRDTRREAQ